MTYVTLGEIKSWEPCRKGWKALLSRIEYDEGYGLDDVKVPLRLLMQVVGHNDLFWVLEYAKFEGVLSGTQKAFDAPVKNGYSYKAVPAELSHEERKAILAIRRAQR